jgi:GNAT superfamily N-acetyltransferase
MEGIPAQKEFGEIVRDEDTLEIRKFGTETVVGRINLVKATQPVEHIQISTLMVNKDEQGKGFASQLMAEVEKMSKEQNVPLLLNDAIDENKSGQNQGSVGMYAKRKGWTSLPDRYGRPTYYFVYGAEDKVIKKFVDYFLGEGPVQ